MAGSLTDEELLPRLVDQIRATFGARLRRGAAPGRRRWQVEAAAGEPVPAAPDGRRRRSSRWARIASSRSRRGARAPPTTGCSTRSSPRSALASKRARLQSEAAEATELAQANDLRAGLLQAVSHDLRTPLASIKASITSLRQTDVTWTARRDGRVPATIEEETDRLTDLVEQPPRHEPPPGRRARVPACRETSLEEVVPARPGRARRRGPASVLDVPEDAPAGDADPVLLERAVANLVDNAITFSPTSSRRASRPAPSPDGCSCGSSTGARHPGRASASEVFQPFQRLVDHGQPASGSGSPSPGLHRGMGGELVIEDTPGGGTTMVVALARACRGRRLTAVLVVDDEAPIRRALTRQPPRPRLRGPSGRHGRQALQLAARHHPDVVILDLGLPGIDGIEVVRGLRGWTNVPIIILSARGAEADKVAALDAGADDYVAKPFGMDELLARLRAAVRRAAPVDETPRRSTPSTSSIDLADKRVTAVPTASRSGSRRPSGHLLEVLARNAGRLVAPASCSRRCGDRSTARRATTCASTWPTCAASWNPRPPAPLPPHRAGHGLPVRALRVRGRLDDARRQPGRPVPPRPPAGRGRRPDAGVGDEHEAAHLLAAGEHEQLHALRRQLESVASELHVGDQLLGTADDARTFEALERTFEGRCLEPAQAQRQQVRELVLCRRDHFCGLAASGMPARPRGGCARSPNAPLWPPPGSSAPACRGARRQGRPAAEIERSRRHRRW